ncbi:MAG: lysine 2,3-aminomutase, partial [Alphaproteobacteria bacterium]
MPRDTGPQTTLRSPQDLIAAGLVDPADAPDLDRLSAAFAVAVTPAMVAAIRPGDPADPVARQFVPAAEELDVRPEELADP